jgi:regulator of nucleoside diphosphate kinase
MVSKLDKERVLSSVTSSGTPPDYILRLLARIYSAVPVNPKQVPAELVTMNSVVRIQDIETDEIDIYALVYKDDYDNQDEWISVESKLGSALLGRSIGDEIEIPSRRGSHTVRIIDIDYQPERAGHFDR